VDGKSGGQPDHEPLSVEEERIGAAIVDAAYTVHSALGPGLLEHVYEVCLCHELAKRDIPCRRQVDVAIEYDGVTFQGGLRLDVLVGDLVICELKCTDGWHPVHRAQLLTQLKFTGKRLGYLINFNVAVIRKGIHRYVL